MTEGRDDRRTKGQEDRDDAVIFPSSLPPSGTVHIYYAHLDPPAPVIARLEESLAPDEWARLRRFHFADDARRYAVRRGILRHLLGGYLGIPPAEIAFVYGPQRKPALAESLIGADLRFNLSDSGEMAVYAFAVGQELGVDIEAQRDFPDARQLAERFFSPAENDWLRQQPLHEESAAFLRCWTCKEAVVKVLGDGLMTPLQTFTVAHWQTPPPPDLALRIAIRLVHPSAQPTHWLQRSPGSSQRERLETGDWGLETCHPPNRQSLIANR